MAIYHKNPHDQYNFYATLQENNLSLPPLAFETLWLNITTFCNQACDHCHMDASPSSLEFMDRATINKCLNLLEENPQCLTLDITGGEPELHPDFKYVVIRARQLEKKVTVRHNLTVTIDENPINGENMEYLPEFFAENRVTVLASLPHYMRETVNQIRGRIDA